MDHKQERTTVHRVVDLEQLPRKKPSKVLGRFGDGSRCACCSQIIDLAETRYEVAFGAHAPPLNMHLSCYLQWSAHVVRTGR